MINVFLRWVSEQRTLASKGRTRHRGRAFKSELEPLEWRLVLTSLQLYAGHPVLSDSSRSEQTFTIYEDLTGNGFTSDDVLLPFSIPVTTYEFTRTEGEIQIPGGGLRENDTVVTVTTNKTIPNGGLIVSSGERVWDDLIPNSRYDYSGGNNSPSYHNGWSGDHIVYEHSINDYIDYEHMFPAGQTWVRTDSFSTATGYAHTYVRKYTVHGHAYEDLNGNGHFDTGEPPGHANVYLDQNHDGIANEPSIVGGSNDGVGSHDDGTFEATFVGRGEIGFGLLNDDKYTMLTEGYHHWSAPTPNEPDNILDNVVFGIFSRPLSRDTCLTMSTAMVSGIRLGAKWD